MSVTAKFIADFSSFSNAVEKAEVQLRDMDTGANKVSASLNKMADSFSGRKVIQDATLAAEAVDRIGGTSKLTAAELTKVQTQAQLAADKLRVMGQDVPKSLQNIVNSTKTANTSLEQMRSLAGQLGIAFSIGAVVQFGKDILQMGDDIQRTADRTGLMTDEVQKLSYIASQSGNTLEEMTGAIGQMQNRLASGDQSAVAALKNLNLTFEELSRLSPYEQLEKIAQSVSQIPNPANRAQVAMDLFGRSGIAILPTLTAQFHALGEEAPRMSDQTVKALDKAGDALNKFQLSVKVWAAESYNFFGRVFDHGVAQIYKFIGTSFELIAALNSIALKIPGAAKAFPDLAVNMKIATDQARWYKDAAALLTTQVEKKTEAVRAVAPVILQAANAHTGLTSATKGATTATRAHVDAIKEEVVLTAQQVQVLALLEKVHQHEEAALRAEEAAFRATQRSAAEYIAHLKTANVVLLEGVRNLSSYVPLVGAAAEATGNLSTVQAEGVIASKSWAASFIDGINGILGTMTRGFGSFGNTLRGIGSGIATDFLGGLLSAIPGIGPLVAQFAGPLLNGFKAIGSAIGSIFDRNKGRDMVENFAEGFGGFDALHNQLLMLGDEGEQLWIRLTQGVGRNNKDQAKAAIEEVQRALEALKQTAGSVPSPYWNYGGEAPEGGAATGGIVGSRNVIPFASGGMAKLGTDTVPAMLTPGEIILNAAQQKNLAGTMGGGITINVNGAGNPDAVAAAIMRTLRQQKRLNVA